MDLTTAEGFVHMFPNVAIPSLPFIGSYGIKVKSLADSLERILFEKFHEHSH